MEAQAHSTAEADPAGADDFRGGSTRYAQLNDLLAVRRLRLKFPPELEAEFRRYHALENAALLRTTIFYVLLLYLGLGLGIIALVPYQALGYWPVGYSALALVIVAGVVCSRIRWLDPWHQTYVTILGFTGIAATISLGYVSSGELMRQANTIGVIHACVIIGAMIGLRFVPALIAVWGGGLTAIAVISLSGHSVDWLLFAETFCAGSAVGSVLAWMMDRNGRQVFLQRNLTQLEKARSDALAERMREMSRHDGLTGLANRRYFDEMLPREWQRCMRDGSSLSLMFIDVDFFKPFNDHYGHQEGDRCLSEVGKILATFARRPGDLAARYGGEEFVVLYPQTGPDAARKLAEELREAVTDLNIPHAHSSAAKHVTISVGVATTIPEEEHAPEELIKEADHALYRAKDKGRNRVEAA